MKVKKFGTVIPDTFLGVSFECSNKAFYKVKEEVYEIADSIGIEIQDGYITEKCDYEGDLEEIIIYPCKRNEFLRISVLNFYGIPISSVEPEDAIHLSII
jgi:hypothetical protein